MASPGNAVEVILSTGTHASCSYAMTNPAGEVALGIQGGAFSTEVSFQLYAPSGVPRNVTLPLIIPTSRQDIDPWFHWTSAGYAGLVHDVPPPVSLRTWSSSGAVLATTQDYAVAMAPDPSGGTVMLGRAYDPSVSPPYGPTKLEWLSPSGAVLRTATLDDNPGMLLIDWSTGHVLTFLPSMTGLRARWYDGAGTPLTAWFDTGALPDAEAASMHLLVDGTIALSDGRSWWGIFRDGVEGMDPPPAWLAARPATRLATIRQGRGYAVLPSVLAGADPTLQTQVEILTAAGDSCGTVSLPPAVAVPDVAKAPVRVEVGQDGTVLQTELLTGPNLGMGVHCGFRWWPALLR